MNREEIKAIIENIFLASDEPINAERLAETIQNGVSRKICHEIIGELQGDYESRNLQIVAIAEGFMLSTRKDYADWIKKYFRMDRQARLSQPALDTLSIIAYKQPITRAEVEEIRGVDSSRVIKTLLEKNVVITAGRKKVIGRPMMFKTTRKFLDYFGLKALSDLPILEDLKDVDIVGEHLDETHMQTKLLFENSNTQEEMEDNSETENYKEKRETIAELKEIKEVSPDSINESESISSENSANVKENESCEAKPIEKAQELPESSGNQKK